DEAAGVPILLHFSMSVRKAKRTFRRVARSRRAASGAHACNVVAPRLPGLFFSSMTSPLQAGAGPKDGAFHSMIVRSPAAPPSSPAQVLASLLDLQGSVHLAHCL